MEYKQIIYFITICESNTITKAAEKLSISHQALSRVLNDLEKDLDVELIIRTPKGIKTTNYGKVLYEAFSGHVAEYGAIEKNTGNEEVNEDQMFLVSAAFFLDSQVEKITIPYDSHSIVY